MKADPGTVPPVASPDVDEGWGEENAAATPAAVTQSLPEDSQCKSAPPPKSLQPVGPARASEEEVGEATRASSKQIDMAADAGVQLTPSGNVAVARSSLTPGPVVVVRTSAPPPDLAVPGASVPPGRAVLEGLTPVVAAPRAPSVPRSARAPTLPGGFLAGSPSSPPAARATRPPAAGSSVPAPSSPKNDPSSDETSVAPTTAQEPEAVVGARSVAPESALGRDVASKPASPDDAEGKDAGVLLPPPSDAGDSRVSGKIESSPLESAKSAVLSTAELPKVEEASSAGSPQLSAGPATESGSPIGLSETGKSREEESAHPTDAPAIVSVAPAILAAKEAPGAGGDAGRSTRETPAASPRWIWLAAAAAIAAGGGLFWLQSRSPEVVTATPVPEVSASPVPTGASSASMIAKAQGASAEPVPAVPAAPSSSTTAEPTPPVAPSASAGMVTADGSRFVEIRVRQPKVDIFFKGKKIGTDSRVLVELLPGEQKKVLLLVGDGYLPRKLVVDGKTPIVKAGMREVSSAPESAAPGGAPQ